MAVATTLSLIHIYTNPIYSNAKKLLPYAVILVLLTVLVMMNLKRSKPVSYTHLDVYKRQVQFKAEAVKGH